MRPDRWNIGECNRRARRLNPAQELWLLIEVLRWSPSGLDCLPLDAVGDPWPPDHWKFTGLGTTGMPDHHCLNPECGSKATLDLGIALDHSGYDETTCPEIRDVDVEVPPHHYYREGPSGHWKPDPALLFPQD